MNSGRERDSMSKELFVSATPHETRLAILEDDELAEIYYERENEYTLAGSIYKGRVTRVLPGMQSAFVDIGLERDAFLYVTDFLEEQEDSDEFERTPLDGAQQRRGNGRNRQQQPEQEAAAPTGEEAGEGESPAGTRRWRGRRGRGRGMRQRGRDEQDRDNNGPESQVQDQPVEAGSEDIRYDAPAPSSAYPADNRVYESEATFERQSATAPAGSDRILLPGESLSKYGGKPTPAESKAQEAAMPAFKPNYTAPKPSTLIDAPITWDGSALLPGESRAVRKEPRAESAFAAPAVAEPESPAVEAEHEHEAESQESNASGAVEQVEEAAQ